jgi:phosphoglycolate phosphatase-like HAD superfamily hydrolase
MILNKLGRSENDSTRLGEAVEFYAKQYNRIVENGAVNCPEVPGARRALEILHKDFALYVNSTTPREPLVRIIKKRGLHFFFADIYGGGQSKSENLKRIFRRENIKGHNCLVVGDGMSDLNAALECDCRFIGVKNEFESLSKGMKLIDSLHELPRMVIEVK